ncbi:SMP-LTD domain-containing protein, partial [Trichostrongylus colubriformis]
MEHRTRKLSFASVRLNDLSDDYGFGDDLDLTIIDDEAVEEAQEAGTAAMGDEHSTRSSVSADNENSEAESLHTIDQSSIGSNESKDQSTASKIGAFFDRAKTKGKKLVGKKEHSKSPEMSETAAQCTIVKSTSSQDKEDEMVQVEENPESVDSPAMIYSLGQRFRSMPFFKYRTMLLGILLSITFVFPGFLTGLLWGLYLSFIGFLYLFVSEPKAKIDRHPSFANLDDIGTVNGKFEQACEADEGEGDALGMHEGVVYRGWMNELKGKYSPATYHVNNAQSVLVRLEGTTLRISRPEKAVLKHAFYEDPTLTQPQPTMVSQTLYSLEGARVSLRPKRLASRRWWSRKYPIYIRFARRPSDAVNIATPLSRSVSMHPVKTAPDRLPFMELSYDEGYTAETDSSDENDTEQTQMCRASSFSDMPDFLSMSEGAQRPGKEKSLYLFGRAAREKERWFHLLREACAQSRTHRRARAERSCSVHYPDNFPNKTSSNLHASSIFEDAVYRKIHKQFAEQISIMLGYGVAPPERGSTVSLDLGTMKWKPGLPEENTDLVESINSLGTRIFFDFCRDEFWATQVKHKIQSKLATIHLPYFIETLELSSLTLGRTAPRIVGVYTPKLNEWGIWVDLE